MDKNESITSNMYLMFIKKVMEIMFPFITFCYASRTLGVEKLGQINFVKSFTQFFIIICNFGVYKYGVREGSILKRNKNMLSKFTLEMLVINTCSTTVSLILLILFCICNAKIHDYTLLVIIFSLSILISSLGIDWLFQAVEDYKYYALKTIATQGISLVFMFIFVKTPEDVFIYAGLIVFASYGSYLYNYVRAKKYINFRTQEGLQIKKHLTRMTYLFLVSAEYGVYAITDSVMLGFMRNDREVGLYSAAVKMNRIVLNVITAFSVAAMPRLSFEINRKNKNTYMDLAGYTYSMVFLLSAPVFYVMLVLKNEMLILFSGAEFMEASSYAGLMSIIIPMISFSSATNSIILEPNKMDKSFMICSLMGALTNICINLFLIPDYGIYGAVTATIISEFVVAFSAAVYSSRIINLKLILLKICKYYFISCPIILFSYVIKRIVKAELNVVIATVTVSIMYYCIFLYLVKDPVFLTNLSVISNKIRKDEARHGQK